MLPSSEHYCIDIVQPSIVIITALRHYCHLVVITTLRLCCHLVSITALRQYSHLAIITVLRQYCHQVIITALRQYCHLVIITALRQYSHSLLISSLVTRTTCTTYRVVLRRLTTMLDYAQTHVFDAETTCGHYQGRLLLIFILHSVMHDISSTLPVGVNRPLGFNAKWPPHVNRRRAPGVLRLGFNVYGSVI